MTVKEFIIKLQEYPEYATIGAVNCCYEERYVGEIEILKASLFWDDCHLKVQGE